MELGERSHKPSHPGTFAEDHCLSVLPADTASEIARDFDRLDALVIGSDWLEASHGELLNRVQHRSLFRTGYTTVSKETIIDLFGSWSGFQKSIKEFHADQTARGAAERADKLRAIEEERVSGLVPEEFFYATKAVVYCRVGEPPEQQGRILKSKKVYLSGERASDTEILRRYARYTLINYLNREIPQEKEPSEDRIINLVLGYTQKTGKLVGGFPGVILSINSALATEDIYQAIEDLGLYNDLFPSSREDHLRKLLAIGNAPYRNPDAVIWASQKATKSYIHWQRTKQRMSGLAHHLSEDTFAPPEINDDRPREMYGWSRAECIKFGRWLIRLIQADTGEAKITQEIINRSDRLGIGPGSSRLIRRFGSLAKFYVELGPAEAKISRQFSDHRLDEFASLLASLGEKLGRKPTRRDIIAEAKSNPRFPSSHMITGQGYTLRQVYDRAGWPDIYSWGLGDHERHGVNFMLANNGRAPTQKAWDYLSKQKRGPSAALMRFKYPGGFSEFKALVIKQYQGLPKAVRENPSHLFSEPQLQALSMPDGISSATNKRQPGINGTP